MLCQSRQIGIVCGQTHQKQPIDTFFEIQIAVRKIAAVWQVDQHVQVTLTQNVCDAVKHVAKEGVRVDVVDGPVDDAHNPGLPSHQTPCPHIGSVVEFINHVQDPLACLISNQGIAIDDAGYSFDGNAGLFCNSPYIRHKILWILIQ